MSNTPSQLKRQIYSLYRIAAWAQFFLLTIYATYLSLTPNPGSVFTSVWDKLLHVICWFALTVSLRAAWPKSGFPVWAALVLFGYSVMVETLQHFTPAREFSGYDLIGNALGVIAAYLLMLLVWPMLERMWNKRLAG
ncbi:MAG: VanZ family protein [Cellvibrionaceae bacterium]